MAGQEAFSRQLQETVNYVEDGDIPTNQEQNREISNWVNTNCEILTNGLNLTNQLLTNYGIPSNNNSVGNNLFRNNIVENNLVRNLPNMRKIDTRRQLNYLETNRKGGRKSKKKN